MALSSEKKQFYQDALEKVKERLAKAYSRMDSLLDSDNAEYSFDSGEGKQSAKKRGLDEVNKQIEYLESRAIWLMGKLQIGGGLVSLNLRRQSSYYIGGENGNV